MSYVLLPVYKLNVLMAEGTIHLTPTLRPCMGVTPAWVCGAVCSGTLEQAAAKCSGLIVNNIWKCCTELAAKVLKCLLTGLFMVSGGVNPKVPETASQRNIMSVARRLHTAAAPAFSVVLRNVYFVSYMCMIRQFWSVVFQSLV